jgi:hypothetical protein
MSEWETMIGHRLDGIRARWIGIYTLRVQGGNVRQTLSLVLTFLDDYEFSSR